MSCVIMLSIGISGALYLFFDVAQLHFKDEAREEAVSKERLQTIKMPLRDLEKAKDNAELWFGGRLYDIRSYVVINDTVFVSVFHDKGEEGVVKAIVESFEPNDKYSNDNITHVCKHRIHPPGDGKVLVDKYVIGRVAFNAVVPVFYSFKEHFFDATTAIIKPPPRTA